MAGRLRAKNEFVWRTDRVGVLPVVFGLWLGCMVPVLALVLLWLPLFQSWVEVSAESLRVGLSSVGQVLAAVWTAVIAGVFFGLRVSHEKERRLSDQESALGERNRESDELWRGLKTFVADDRLKSHLSELERACQDDSRFGEAARLLESACQLALGESVHVKRMFLDIGFCHTLRWAERIRALLSRARVRMLWISSVAIGLGLSQLFICFSPDVMLSHVVTVPQVRHTVVTAGLIPAGVYAGWIGMMFALLCFFIYLSYGPIVGILRTSSTELEFEAFWTYIREYRNRCGDTGMNVPRRFSS